MSSPIWLDLSRLLWRLFRGRMTGIDRVELAYAEHLLDLAPERLDFVAFDYRGRFRVLPRPATAALVRRARPAWRDGELVRLAPEALRLFLHGLVLSPRARRRGAARPVYVNVSTHPLDWTGSIARFLERTEAAFVPLLHDLIPIHHPEYVPPSWTRRHLRRMATVAAHADGVIVNSATTGADLGPYLRPGQPMLVAPLGVAAEASAPEPPAAGRPYFLCLGTIEPRKNHIMLLTLWRQLAARLGPATPRLVIVGGRGWENEQVIDLLDRCALIRPHVEERGRVPDAEVRQLMAGARALLMPSFAEGFGLPVAEALACGLPVLCSDIPAHREVGRGVPDYLAPLDGPGWERAVLDYATGGSPRRAAQLARLRDWRCSGWRDHVESALAFVDALAVGEVPQGAPHRPAMPVAQAVLAAA
jgi:glycosyltransferase involved in cell wall biosynthesis